MEKPTDREVASNWGLWQEYVDPGATMTREEWSKMSFDECLAFVHECFGCDGTCEDEGE